MITYGRNRGDRRDRSAKKMLFYLCGLCGLCGSFFSSSAQGQQQPAKPSFQSSVEVTSLDVSVVDDRGKPITGLTPADFVVRIDGNARRVVSAEWMALSTDAGAPPPPPPPDGYTTNESATTSGRLIVIAVDQPSIRFGGAMAIGRAANAFIDRLAPSDRVAVAGIGYGAPSTPFTQDRARVKQALSRMVGQKQTELQSLHNVSLSEALDFDRGGSLDAVFNRECSGFDRRSDLET
jgi:hypothetical protein